MPTTNFHRIFITNSLDENHRNAITVTAFVPAETSPDTPKLVTAIHPRTSAADAELIAAVEALTSFSFGGEDTADISVYLNIEHIAASLNAMQGVAAENRDMVTKKGEPLKNAEMLTQCLNVGDNLPMSWGTLGKAGELNLANKLRKAASKATELVLKRACSGPLTDEETARLYMRSGFMPPVDE